MIDDATLAGFRAVAESGPIMLSETVKVLLDEIRRLRGENDNLAHNCIVMLEARRASEADLAAHRAVVRALAERLTRHRDLERDAELLSHPLVVAARKGDE